MAEDAANNFRFQLQVMCGSEKQILQEHIGDLSITSEINQPDKCYVTLTPEGTQIHGDKIKLTDPFQVMLTHEGDAQDPAFSGELAGMKRSFATKGKSGGSLRLTAYDPLHALARGQQTHAYQSSEGSLTDADILQQVIQRNSALKLSIDWGDEGPPTAPYKHIWQRNHTDLDFLRIRTSRLGRWFAVRKDKLLIHLRTTTLSGFTMVLNAARSTDDSDKQLALETFLPHVSTAAQVTSVQVRTWDHAARSHLVCVAPSQAAGGSTTLATNSGKDAIADKHPDSTLVYTHIPFNTADEGNQLAAAILTHHKHSFVTARGSVPGDARLKTGLLVQVSTGDPKHDGKYFITHIHHEYKHSADNARFVTNFRASRDSTDS